MCSIFCNSWLACCVVCQFVCFAAFRASGPPVLIKFQSVSVGGHPPRLAGWIPHDQCVGWYVFRYHRSGANEGVGADVVAADDGSVGPNAGAASHVGAGVLAAAVDRAAWIRHVGEYAAGTEEDVVVARDAFIDAHVVLYLDVCAQNDAGGDHDVLADVAAFAQHGARHNVAEMPNFGARSDAGSFVDDCGFVGLVIHVGVTLF